MVDVISARVQEAYVGWRQSFFSESSENREPVGGQRPNLSAINHQSRRRQNLEKESIKLLRENSLYQIKEIPTKATVVAPTPRPFMGLSCGRCTPGSRDVIAQKALKKSTAVNLLNLGKTYDSKGVISRNFYDIAQAIRVKTFDYKQVSPMVVKDERVKQAIEQITQDRLFKQDNTNKDAKDDVKKLTHSQIHKSEERRAHQIVKQMRSTMSNFLLRLTSWTLYKLLPFFVSSVAISPAQTEMLKKASDSGIPLIFIPLHRSHLDYILVTFILLNYDIRCPLVAAGDNLKIPLFGWLLRGLGAFYIKRRLETNGGEKDITYRVALHTYIVHCLRAQNNIEFFIEGGRTRTGKPLLPKGGILSVIIDAYLDGTIEDALLIPVSMNYDKLVDGNFVREQTGMPKQMETFTGAIKSIWAVLNSHYGNIRVDFNQPFSMRELVRTFQQHPSKLSPPPFLKNPSSDRFALKQQNIDGNGSITIEKLSMERRLSSRLSCSSLYGTDVAVEEQRGLVEAIARHVVYDCTHATAIMSTNAVAFLLLTKYRKGCSLSVLAQELESLTTELLFNNKDVGFTGEPVDVINHVVNLLGPGLIVKEREGDDIIIKPVLIQPNIIELSYYSNCFLPFYALQSIVATALQVLISSSKLAAKDIQIRHDDLVDLSLQFCEMMSQEFILYKPCQKLNDVVNETIENFVYKDILRLIHDSKTEDQMWSRRYAKTLDDDDDDDYQENVCVVYKLGLDEKSVRNRLQMQTVLRPLLEAYCLTASCLPRILIKEENDYITESKFTREVLSELKDALDSGACNYGEAVSIDAIKNCIKLFREWGVLDSHIEGRQRFLNISRQYANELKLSKISELLHKFKTEMPKEVLPSYLNR
ncbi:glycerol-3-phosphate acyltransferase mino isoform X2 [Arctopsyche grandis]